MYPETAINLRVTVLVGGRARRPQHTDVDLTEFTKSTGPVDSGLRAQHTQQKGGFQVLLHPSSKRTLIKCEQRECNANGTNKATIFILFGRRQSGADKPKSSPILLPPTESSRNEKMALLTGPPLPPWQWLVPEGNEGWCAHPV